METKDVEHTIGIISVFVERAAARSVRIDASEVRAIGRTVLELQSISRRLSAIDTRCANGCRSEVQSKRDVNARKRLYDRAEELCKPYDFYSVEMSYEPCASGLQVYATKDDRKAWRSINL